ncbi:hypothetical protein [Enterobacter bugandensis]|uniref:hypothetical protein n=1 Tax=Enterobacter bugandensis TaxID=881260 RepID=UPI003BF8B66A
MTPKVVLKLARIALASLEAEPVAWTTGRYSQNIGYKFGEKEPDEAPCIMSIYWDFDTFRAHTDCDATALRWLEEAIKNTGANPLYTAPPAPVSVPEPIKRNDADGWWMYKGRRVGSGCAEWYNRALDDCRAAMFQSFGNSEQLEPVTTAYKLPANTPCKDAPEHIWLQTAGIWPENGEFSELTWCSDNQHPDDTLYVRADVVTGNSPVIPDGWVMVPVEPTAEMISSGIAAHFERSQTQIHDRPAPGPMECAYVAMLAAAAQQQEVTQALAKGMERYGDAMQELAKKEVK